jgi:hypothetical protein
VELNTLTDFKVAATMAAPIANVKRIEPEVIADCSRCEGNVNIGIFFDGTDNNWNRDEPKLGHTNIVRLFRSYLDKPGDGYYRLYVPGVGTPFPEIGEAGFSAFGNGFGIGCEQRVLYGLCWMLNVLHRAAHADRGFLNALQMRALCTNKAGSLEDEEVQALAELYIKSGGMLMPDTFGQGDREAILKKLISQLGIQLFASKVKIKECYIDVFGFSRGAAQARVFCNWLEAVIPGGKLASVTIHFRFLGIMDTVASAGAWVAAGSSVAPIDGSHSGWAEVEFLRIAKSVKNCVHFVAMHELRRNFPLDSVTVDGAMPANCCEYAYPGAHSDVGGGYKPGALGVLVGGSVMEGDSMKLSQIPLNHMYECAKKAGAPVDRQRAKGSDAKHDPFAINPAVQKAYNDFLAASSLNARPLWQWAQPYLNWKWEINRRFASLGHVQRANQHDRELLVKFNAMLGRHAAAMDRSTRKGVLEILAAMPGQILRHQDVSITSKLDPEAYRVYELAKSATPTCAVLHHLFDGYVHDSMAGFNQELIEASGYWRYRKGYLGRDKAAIVSNDSSSANLENCG